MQRTCVLLALTLALASPAFADVTLKVTTGGKGMGMSTTASGTTYIKGNKMRTDLQMGDKVQSTIFDLDAQKMYSFDSKKKEADVWEMAAIAGQIEQSIDGSSVKASITPNGQKKMFGSYSADGYDMEISIPATMGGDRNAPPMTITLVGPVWVVKNAPGTADYIGFYKAAVEKGWIFGDPRAAKGQPGQARAMAEMYRQFAELGGIAFETNVQIKMGMGSGGGPMGGLLAKLGNISSTTIVESVAEGPVADELFAPPAGYKLSPKK